ncbi:MAG TPA: hypothetical protein VGH11_13200 [Jatrophihabitans sp.]
MTSLALLSATGFHPHSRHHLAITRTSLVEGQICVQYLVSPTPAELRTTALFECDGGSAIDEKRRIYDCALAYRRSRDGRHVVGALRIGPAIVAANSRVRVLFAPLSGLSDVLFELQLIIRRGVAQPCSLRCIQRDSPSVVDE